ncbi:MAG: division/cell wall cluster transcriptional repressor MraZ [Thermodesulfovibrionia bacterium]|nr:division/cell wall cluster transcriptional repressor MraZ [Thermodesulfovibrionia bacterium]
MPAFSGKYYYTVDPKGRIIIPSPFRKIISAHYNTKLYVTNALFDHCLHIYPQEEWNRLEEKVRDLPKMDKDIKLFKRRVIASATECELDKQGRVLVPAALREDAGINGDIAIVGQIEKIELWNRKDWDAVIELAGIDQESVEEKLANYGL